MAEELAVLIGSEDFHVFFVFHLDVMEASTTFFDLRFKPCSFALASKSTISFDRRFLSFLFRRFQVLPSDFEFHDWAAGDSWSGGTGFERVPGEGDRLTIVIRFFIHDQRFTNNGRSGTGAKECWLTSRLEMPPVIAIRVAFEWPKAANVMIWVAAVPSVILTRSMQVPPGAAAPCFLVWAISELVD